MGHEQWYLHIFFWGGNNPPPLILAETGHYSIAARTLWLPRHVIKNIRAD